jgi:protein-S-isoprenylcysteine O-methyltransferase Ste14
MEGKNVQNPYTNSVHWVLTHGYAAHFVLFLIGVTLDILFHQELFSDNFMRPVGLVMLVLSTLLILWAQFTSRYLPQENITSETFCRGPYCYTRSPTHWGLFFLIIGFGIITNAFFVVITTLIAGILSKSVFLKKEEKLLAEKYGAPYLEYKKKVRI